MDTDWTYYPRNSATYRAGAKLYVDELHTSLGNPATIRCPCRLCNNMQWHAPKIVVGHLCMNEIHPLHVSRILRGESCTTSAEEENVQVPESYQMLKDAYFQDDVVMETIDEESEDDFADRLEEAEQPLYEGSSFTKMSSTVSLYKYKTRHNISDNAFDDLLQLFGGLLPEENVLPNSLYSTKKLLKAFSLGYQKIHACINDCVLFWKGDLEHAEVCPKCDASRWKVDENTNKVHVGVPAKVLRYFPIKNRLRRMFKSAKRAEELTWHYTHRSQDGKMRHPVDSPAWKHIDNKWPAFASEPRNLRLGLSSDGFNPFGDFSSRYSCWPVMLMTYNLPPSLCMSKENIMLTLLIPGPKQPGNDIDVYLQPLIEDLKDLWLNGISVYDASRGNTFNLKAILMWTISDFPAYANLSGYSTKGRKACPVCGVQTCSQWLENGKKHVYMGHRRWLPEDHPFRFKPAWFDGTEEHRARPIQLTGSQIFQVVKGIVNEWGKENKNKDGEGGKRKRKRKRTRKKAEDNANEEGGKEGKRKRKRKRAVDVEEDDDDDGDNPFKLTKRWKKRSMFFDLPYWEELLIRHNLDMMHVEKNICESLLSTLLNKRGKTKDNLNSRKDLEKMGIRKKLAYVLLKKERQIFCERAASMKMPDGYSSDISAKVLLKKCQILGLKSHDLHIFMQQVLPVALRGLLPKGPRIAILRLCATYNVLCQRILDEKELEKLEKEVPETLCMLERFFPPSFFDIMVHLTIHLVQEARIGGPVHLRWMYPPERFLKTLKDYTKNHSNPEGCMAEKYLAQEVANFTSSYFNQAGNVGVQHKRNEDLEYGNVLEGRGFGGKRKNLTQAMLQTAHRYVLLNTAMLDPWREMHKDELKLLDPRLSKNESMLDKKHVASFAAWLSDLVRTSSSVDMPDVVRWLACGPRREVKSCSGFIINGNRFHTKAVEKNTQNSGVFVEGDTYCRASARDTALRFETVHYYGVIREIILLDYYNFKVPLFHCDWANIGNGVKVEDGFTLVNLEKGQHQFERDPFIFASQAKQVFYSRESKTSDWYVVLRAPPRGFYEDGDLDEVEYIPSAPFDASQLGHNLNDDDCLRRDSYSS